MPRQEPRTQICGRDEAAIRLDQSRKFLEVGELVAGEAEIPASLSVSAALSVLAGIAASDAACCAALGRRPRGQDHREAARVLEQVEGGRRPAADLRRLLDLKDTAHYGLIYVSRQKTERRRAGSCFIIATRNRHDYLLNAVRSLLAQTVLPEELCIVDSSDETPARAEIERLCAEARLPLDYVHPAPRGLPVQRNVGIDRTTGDPVFLVDDDVWMDVDVHEEILAEYERWGPELGGVRGAPVHPPDPGRLTIHWRRLFGMGGWWPEASGRMRAGFFVEGVSASADVRTLEYMNGWFMSFKREVFEHERFDEKLSGYASKEDIDFTWRLVRRGYVLVQTPRARIDHLRTPSERLSPFDMHRMNLGNQFYLHRKNMPQTFRHRAGLWWALLGIFVLNVGKAVHTRDRGYVTGLVVGAWEQARGRGLIDPGAKPGPGAGRG